LDRTATRTGNNDRRGSNITKASGGLQTGGDGGMGAIVGFVLGYVLGTRAGPDGYEELVESWKTISSSEEVRQMVSGGIAVLRDLVRQGRGMLVERLAERDEDLIRAA